MFEEYYYFSRIRRQTCHFLLFKKFQRNVQFCKIMQLASIPKKGTRRLDDFHPYYKYGGKKYTSYFKNSKTYTTPIELWHELNSHLNKTWSKIWKISLTKGEISSNKIWTAFHLNKRAMLADARHPVRLLVSDLSKIVKSITICVNILDGTLTQKLKTNSCKKVTENGYIKLHLGAFAWEVKTNLTASFEIFTWLSAKIDSEF